MPALAAVPALAILAIAGLALLLLLAWQQFANAVAKLVPSWHIPGLGNIRGWITDHIADAYRDVAGYLDKYVAPMTHFIGSPFVVITALVNELGAVDHSLYNFTVRVITVSIPRAAAVLRSEARALENRLKLYALGLQHAAMVYALTEARAVESEARTWVAQARAEAVRLADAAEVYARAGDLIVAAQALRLVGDARAFAGQLYQQGVAFTRAEVAAAESAAAALFRQAESDVVLNLHRAESYAVAAAQAAASAALADLTGVLVTDLDQLWPAVPAVIDDVIDVAAGAFTDVVDDLRGLARDVPASVPAAIAAALGIAIPLLRLAKDCTIPNCRNLSQVGRDLQELFGLVEDGALLALLAAVAADPEGAADAATTELAGGMTALANEFADLIGVG